MNFLKYKSWNPFFTGIGIGILSWFSFASADHPLGITSAFENTAALFGKAFNGSAQYFSENSPKIDWEWALVIGVFFGALLSSKLSGDRNNPVVPQLWRQRFGDSSRRRLIWAFFGGVIMMYGARIAQGCTSGHGISGVLQFAVASWIFVPVFGIAGILTAKSMYGKKER